jgi:hypothetical protein
VHSSNASADAKANASANAIDSDSTQICRLEKALVARGGQFFAGKHWIQKKNLSFVT